MFCRNMVLISSMIRIGSNPRKWPCLGSSGTILILRRSCGNDIALSRKHVFDARKRRMFKTRKRWMFKTRKRRWATLPNR